MTMGLFLSSTRKRMSAVFCAVCVISASPSFLPFRGCLPAPFETSTHPLTSLLERLDRFLVDLELCLLLSQGRCRAVEEFAICAVSFVNGLNVLLKCHFRFSFLFFASLERGHRTEGFLGFPFHLRRTVPSLHVLSIS